ncbi:MAG: hypothetical protein F9K22_09350 [Bacteroidetes bacterium]|nr:MAG: hypothetical protein F9K22_09350 [Bacteroidota bacterium]
MNGDLLYEEYLRPGTAGYAVISAFYFRYADALSRLGLSNIDDVVHEVFLSLSSADLENVRNPSHYLLRAVKLHCWTLLDKALRVKRTMTSADEADELPGDPGHPAEMEGTDLLAHINLFKAGLGAKEREVLNLLIDDTERSAIAAAMALNMNTLDTTIRRLRLKLAEHLRRLGYSEKTLERFL